MGNTGMTARSLFDTFFNIGMTALEAYKQCEDQGIFTVKEMEELKNVLEYRM